jgi:hypothetical protein
VGQVAARAQGRLRRHGAAHARTTFAAWYHLPIYFVSYEHNTAVYFGHFGVRTSGGAWSRAPRFHDELADYSNMAPAEYQSRWPRDEQLRKLSVMADDEPTFLGKGTHVGAYLDEIHLNKRAARLVYFVMLYLGSANLADGRNTYNLTPEALRTGDVLLYRRATRGSGHTMVIVRAQPLPSGKLQAEDVYGNEPPAQPLWEGPGEARRNFTSDEGGGPSKNSAGEIYSHIGGGLKRFRVAKNLRGMWTNTFMAKDEASWINDTDFQRIGARPAQFDTLLGELDPMVQRDLLISVIAQKRQHLRESPASCAARERREAAFSDLYSLMGEKFNLSRDDVDRRYRLREDYVFAPLDYLKSRTCCWNTSTPAMYDIIMAYDKAHATNGSMCVPPAVFQASAGGYEPFASFARSIGRGAEWGSWRADEDCPQQANLNDTPLDRFVTPWCEIPPAPAPSDGGTPTDGGVPPTRERSILDGVDQ